MDLLRYEWKKLFCMPALWIFLALCLIYNGLLIFSAAQNSGCFNDSSDFVSIRGTFNDISAMAQGLGQRVDDGFLYRLRQLPSSGSRDILLEAVSENEDVARNTFSNQVVEKLSRFYQTWFQQSPRAASWMEWKYRQLERRAEQLAEDGAAYDLYAGPATYFSHSFLFGSLIRAILLEAAVLSMLSTLYLAGYERAVGTEGLLCASRRGRRMWRKKAMAGVLAVPLLYGLLAIPSLSVYFILWDYSGVWRSSVSSRFNYFTDLMVSRPFYTWGDFTVAGYLGAVLALGLALVMVFSLMASFLWTLVRSTYGAALVLILWCVGELVLQSALGEWKLWPAYLVSGFQPVSLWLWCDAWFTEAGSSAVIPWQETAATLFHLVLWGGGVYVLLRRFERKDVV